MCRFSGQSKYFLQLVAIFSAVIFQGRLVFPGSIFRLLAIFLGVFPVHRNFCKQNFFLQQTNDRFVFPGSIFWMVTTFPSVLSGKSQFFIFRYFAFGLPVVFSTDPQLMCIFHNIFFSFHFPDGIFLGPILPWCFFLSLSFLLSV